MNECTLKLPGGSEEKEMANLSLARIMYGTSEDLQSSTHTTALTLSSLAAQLPAGGEKTGAGTETLGELLHRAWTNLSGKH
jgi:hypothetical protein